MDGTVDWVAAWTGMWGRIVGGADVADLVLVLSYVGVGFVVFAVIKWGWSRRRGSAQAGLLGWPMFVGAALAAPTVVIPAVLWLLQLPVNAIINFAG